MASEHQGGSARVAAAKDLIEGLGGKMECFYFALGATDVYAIADLPDNASAAATALKVSAGGGATVRTVVLRTALKPTKPPPRTRHTARRGRSRRLAPLQFAAIRCVLNRRQGKGNEFGTTPPERWSRDSRMAGLAPAGPQHRHRNRAEATGGSDSFRVGQLGQRPRG
ncbi:MAG: GYD domain-containing protein [Acidimicrobiales bacterium]